MERDVFICIISDQDQDYYAFHWKLEKLKNKLTDLLNVVA